jgi:hypothetical protein
MKQAVKATVLVLAVSLLSGCSSSPKLADKPQANTECDEVKKIYDDFSSALTATPSTKETYRKLYLTRSYYLLENPKCFTSVQIAAARAEIIIATR